MLSNMSPNEAGHLWILLFRAFRAVEDTDKKSIRRLGFDSISDFAVLEILHSQGRQPVNTIGKKIMLTSGSITTAIDRLQRKEWVVRNQDPEDRRVYWVELTELGRERIGSVFDTHMEDLLSVFGILEPAESVALATLLKKVGKHAQSLDN